MSSSCMAIQLTSSTIRRRRRNDGLVCWLTAVASVGPGPCCGFEPATIRIGRSHTELSAAIRMVSPSNGTVLCVSTAEPDAEPVSSPARWHVPRARTRMHGQPDYSEPQVRPVGCPEAGSQGSHVLHRTYLTVVAALVFTQGHGIRFHNADFRASG